MNEQSNMLLRPFSNKLTSTIVIMATIMGFVSAFCFVGLAYHLIRSAPKISEIQGDLTTWIIGNFHTPIILLISALFTGLFGVFFIRLAKSSLAHVIPPEDRILLGKLLSKVGGAEGVRLYTQLSSLKGFSGTFSHLGITGLPLATIGLTLIFALFSIWISDNNTPNGAFLDLAKLTLGAFIGSFVQRQITPESPKAEAERLAAEKVTVEQVAAEKAAAEKAAAEQAAAEKAAAEKAAAEQAATEKAVAEKAAAEQAAAEKAKVEKADDETAEGQK